MKADAMMASRIASTGVYLPKRVLTNADLERIVETSDEWIVSRTGIKERRIAEPNEMASDMGAHAAKQALDRANISPDQVDLIITATLSPDAFFPSTACYIQEKIGATRAAAFDLQAACSGFLYGLIVADQFIKSGTYKNILVIGTEKISSVIDWTDRNTCVLFGDGAGAVLVQARAGERGILSHQLGANGEHHDMLYLKNNNSLRTVGHQKSVLEDAFIFMSGKEVFKQAVNVMAAAATKALEDAGCTIDDLRCVITHQANIRIIDAVADKLEVPKDRCFVNVQKYGNISAACIPVALHEAQEHFPLKRGDKILLIAFGGGLTWAAAVLEW